MNVWSGVPSEDLLALMRELMARQRSSRGAAAVLLTMLGIIQGAGTVIFLAVLAPWPAWISIVAGVACTILAARQDREAAGRMRTLEEVVAELRRRGAL